MNTLEQAVQATVAREAAGPTVTAGQWVTITRPSAIDGRPYTRRVHLEETWVNLADMDNRFGEAWIVTNAPGHPYRIHEVHP